MRRFIFFLLGLLLAATGALAQGTTTGSFYHAGQNRSGFYVVPGLTWATAPQMHRVKSFKGGMIGQAAAQPLYWLPPNASNGMIITASLSGYVQAFDSVTGTQIWSTQVAPTLPNMSVPCGAGSPYGVSGTPVIDAAQGTIYLDSLTQENNAPQHELYGLSLVDGSILPGWPINVQAALAALGQSFNPSNQDQHGGLALVGGTIYVSYGGLGGDCGSYRGWILSLPEASPQLSGVWVSSGEWAGIWSPGGVTYDGTSLFVTTGNTILGTQTWSDGESVQRIPFDLSHSSDTHDYFAPLNWPSLDKLDSDMGASGPLPIDVPVAGGGTQPMIFSIDKGGTVYLTDRTNLGGIGGALKTKQVTSDKIRTAPAAYPSPDGVYVAFKGNARDCPVPGANTVTVLDITDNPAPSIRTAWCAAPKGGGSPIVTTSDGSNDAMVWTLGVGGDNRLHGFRGDTGAVLFAGGAQTDGLEPLHRFETILAAEGRFFIAAKNRLYAFSPDPAQR